MFHMTNNSSLFKTSAEMEDEGFWLGAGNVFTKGAVRFLPLYEGKLVQMYDHRAANIVVNPANLHRPAQQVAATLTEHQDTEYSPTCQFWVDRQDILRRALTIFLSGVLGLGT